MKKLSEIIEAVASITGGRIADIRDSKNVLSADLRIMFIAIAKMYRYSYSASGVYVGMSLKKSKATSSKFDLLYEKDEVFKSQTESVLKQLKFNGWKFLLDK